MLFQTLNQLGAFSVWDRDKVLNSHRVEHLSAKALGHQTGADALTGGIDGCGSTSRTAADHQHVKL